MENSNDKKKREEKVGGLLFVAFMFLGIGLGVIFGNFLAGLLIGMGVGFLAKAIFHLSREKKS